MTLNRRTIILIAAVSGVFVVLAGIGVYGLIVGPRAPHTPPMAEPSSRPTTAPPPAMSPLHPIVSSGDAEVFAGSVAHAIFDWDTADNVMPAELIDHALTVADPTGFETPGFREDLTTYLPTKEQWSVLRQFDTAQSLTIDSIGIPDSWPAIAADPANEIADGTVAITITGSRVRTGGWNGEESTKTYPVEFTMFVSCPDDGTCSVLRLSQLGAALH